MSLEKHVVSLELAKQLKEAGYPQETLHYWEIHEAWEEKGDFSGARVVTHIYPKTIAYAMNTYAAPLASELGELLPDYISHDDVGESEEYGFVCFALNKMSGFWTVEYSNQNMGGQFFEGTESKSLPNALAQMWLVLKSRELV